MGATSLAISPDGAYLATGSSSGVVNVYKRPQGLLQPLILGVGGVGGKVDATPPVKALMNLTTTVDTLRFNHDSQVRGREGLTGGGGVSRIGV